MWICGPRTAVIDNGDITTGYGFQINGATNVVLAGMTVRNAQKGVAVLNSKAITVADIRVENIGDEAIHLEEPDHRQHGHRQLDRHDRPARHELRRGRLHRDGAGQLVHLQQLPAGHQRPQRDRVQHDQRHHRGVDRGQGRHQRRHDVEEHDGRRRDHLLRQRLARSRSWATAGSSPATRATHSPADAIQVWNTDTDYGFEQHRLRQRRWPTPFPGYGVRMPVQRAAGNVVGCDNTAPAAALGVTNKTCQN